jgi:hypothetical protein
VDTWIERTCRGKCVRQAVALGLATAVAGLVAAGVVAEMTDAVTGPHPIDGAKLAAAASRSDLGHEFVEIECRDAVESGVTWEETSSHYGVETSREVTPFWAVPFGEKVLLVKSAEKPQGRVAGETTWLDDSVEDKFDREARAALLPFVLDVGDPRWGAWILNAAFVGSASWLAFHFVRSTLRARDVRRHPAVARFAAAGDLAAVSAQIEAELAAPDVVRFRGRAFTRSFLVDERRLRFDVRRWSELAWAYKKVTKRRGTTFDPVLHFEDGGRLSLKGALSFGREASEDAVDAALAVVAERAPWAAHGHDDATERNWRRERAKFLELVARRRAEALAGRTPAA